MAGMEWRTCLSPDGLVDVPEDVGLDDVQAAVLGLLHQPRPHLQETKPWRRQCQLGRTPRETDEEETGLERKQKQSVQRKRARIRTSGVLRG